MKLFKRFLLLILLTVFISLPTLKGDVYFIFETDTHDINFVDGIRHEKITGTINLDQNFSKQQYNVLDFRLSENDDLRLVSVNAFAKNGFGFQTLPGMIQTFEMENPTLEVVAGFNGGFYHINDTGEPRHTHINEYEVLQPKTSKTATVLASMTDGSAEFKEVKLDGYEVVVYNEFNEVKKRVKVDNINKESVKENDVSLYFDHYEGTLDEDANYIVVDTFDIKSPINKSKSEKDYYSYAKGYYNKDKEVTEVASEQYLIKSTEIEEIIEEGDIVLYHARIKGFEEVRYAVGTHSTHSVVLDSKPISTDPTASMQRMRHPRTAVGIKENGDPFVMVVDGRDEKTPRDGVNFAELSQLLLKHGAVTAFNFDGGGSSVLMLKNGKTEGNVEERFDTLNYLSDGRQRSISQGYLLVKGDNGDKPVELEYPDNRSNSDTPDGLYVDKDLNLNFNNVKDATSYVISINDDLFETRENKFSLKGLKPGKHEIKVRVKGNETLKTSKDSDLFTYHAKEMATNEILDWLNNFAKYTVE